MMAGQTIHHGVSRNVRQISIIACVSAAGESITPYVITSSGSAVVCEQLKKHGVRVGVDLVMKVHPKPYVNAEICFDYIKTVFYLTLPSCVIWRHLLKKTRCYQWIIVEVMSQGK
jgi:hypothetical protein